MAQQGFKAANRRYKRAFWPVMAVYVAICFAGPFVVFGAEAPSTLLAAGMAVLNGLPIVGVFWLMFRAAEETDEYTRLQQYKAMAFGGAAVASLATLAGFLQLYDVVGELWVFWLGPGFFCAYGAALHRMCSIARRDAA